MPNRRRAEKDRRIPPGRILTDGIFEATSSQDVAFGTQRALEIVRGNRSRPAAEILETLYGAVCEFAQDGKLSDDVTAIVIKVEQ